MNETRTDEQSREMPELIDCGQASEKTRGVPLMFLFELSFPPCDKLFLL